MSTALIAGYSDHTSAIAPVTNGAATLVPSKELVAVDVPRLVMFPPGAVSPRPPIDLPMFESGDGLPLAVQAATGITHGCRVNTELPTVP